MGERRFYVGQRVRVVGGPRAGEIAAITSELRPYRGRRDGLGYPIGTPIHELDLPSLIDGKVGVAAPPSYLEPIDDDSRLPAEFTAEDRWIVELLKKASVST